MIPRRCELWYGEATRRAEANTMRASCACGHGRGSGDGARLRECSLMGGCDAKNDEVEGDGEYRVW
jgi:hypothetical protein